MRPAAPEPMRVRTISLALLSLGVFGCAEDEDPRYEGDPEVAPEDPADLAAWVKLEGYRGWEGESAAHSSVGPHFGDVRVFINPALATSLSAGNEHHPPGSAAVKELFGEGGQGRVRGWSISLKVAPTEGPDPDPDAWYWFEIYDGEVIADAPAAPGCTNCHSSGFGSGTDYVLTEYPLR